VTKRWQQRPPGSTWGDWGEDDELGRINLLTPAKVLEGVREVEHGLSFSLSFARHLGLEHMAAHGVQGRGVLIDLAHHLGTSWQPVDLKTLQEIMAADDVVVEPGDMLLLHTGFATRVLAWGRNPDPVASRPRPRTSTRTTPRCWTGSPTRGSRRSWRTTTRSRGWCATGTGSRTRCSRSTLCACSSSAFHSASCGTCTNSRPGYASTAAADSC